MLKFYKNNFTAGKSTVILTIAHFAILGLLYTLFLHFGVIKTIPNSSTLLKWDAVWYDNIKNEGYIYIANSMCNMAFFPLFPLIWNLSSLSALGISCVNVIFFTVSFIKILQKYELGNKAILFLLSTPSFIFFVIPYSESLFLLAFMMVFYGYANNKPLLRITGFYFASIVKSFSVIFIPAIMIITAVNFYQNKSFKKNELLHTIFSSLASMAGLLTVVAIQGIQTGKWFYFIDIQIYWGRHWQIPKFPITTIDARGILSIDSIAFSVGSVCLYFLLRWFYVIIKTKRFSFNTGLVNNDVVVLSLLCISGTLLLDICFTSYIGNSSNIWSINRHILSGPFFIIAAAWYLKYGDKIATDRIIALILILNIFFTGLYQYPVHLLVYCLFFAALACLKYFPKFNIVFCLGYCMNTCVQIYLLDRFLKGCWVG